MELTKLIARFIETQNNLDSRAYVECFTDFAVVHDEGKVYNGKEKILQWIERANEQYQSFMKPLKYEEAGTNAVLTAEVSGTFPGSPIVLHFNFGLKGDLIDSLKVTG